MDDLDIGEVARRTGLAVSTLRYYEERGLIASSGRIGLRRQFPPTVVERLGLIAMGRAAGFSLAEIAGMFGADGTPDIDRGLLAAKADALDEQVRRLQALGEGLRHAAACPAPSHMECPTFRGIVGAVVGDSAV